MGRLVTIAAAVAVLSFATTSHAERPGPGVRYDEGAELLYVDSQSGRFRVWYVTTSEHAVDAEDTSPADGIPDFAVTVAAVADETYEALITERGYRPPLVDTEHLPAELAGGDERFDIYLINFVNADGSHVVDACLSDTNQCVGHVLMENDFEGFNYPSDDIAIRVLVSHEYFHAIQNAYDADQDVKWVEGTAVWIEEQVFPEQEDYERFLPYFLAKPFRAFDRPSGAALGDPYPYGAALWPTFLAERHSPEIVREIWETSADGTDFLTATDTVLASRYDSSLEQAWLTFTQWNLFTGERADAERAYAAADTWESVFLEDMVSGDGFDVELQIAGMSARYVPIALPDIGEASRHLSLVTESGAPVQGTAYLWDGVALGEAIPLQPSADDPNRAELTLQWQGATTLFVVVTGATRGELMRSVILSMDGGSGGGGCQIRPGGPAPGHSTTLGVAIFGLFIIRRWSRAARPA